MRNRIRSIVTSSILTLVVLAALLSMALVMNDAQTAQADASTQAVTVSVDAPADVVYLPLTDAPPFRDITQQRLAPID